MYLRAHTHTTTTGTGRARTPPAVTPTQPQCQSSIRYQEIHTSTVSYIYTSDRYYWKLYTPVTTVCESTIYTSDEDVCIPRDHLVLPR